MAKNDYLVISRGKWNEAASQDDVQTAIDQFYIWYERSLALGRMKPGSRLSNTGKVVAKGAITDGPYGEAKELVGGYWFIVADTLEDAARIASENPCIAHGLTLEVRPLEEARALAAAVTNETPAGWIASEA